MSKPVSMPFLDGFAKISKLLLYAVVALEVIEFTKDRIESVQRGDYKPANSVSHEVTE